MGPLMRMSMRMSVLVVMHVPTLLRSVSRAVFAPLLVAVAVTLRAHLPVLYPRFRPLHDHPLCYWAV